MMPIFTLRCSSLSGTRNSSERIPARRVDYHSRSFCHTTPRRHCVEFSASRPRRSAGASANMLATTLNRQVRTFHPVSRSRFMAAKRFTDWRDDAGFRPAMANAQRREVRGRPIFAASRPQVVPRLDALQNLPPGNDHFALPGCHESSGMNSMNRRHRLRLRAKSASAPIYASLMSRITTAFTFTG